ncbi:MAG: CsbD family protein [Caldilineaceae bacterium]
MNQITWQGKLRQLRGEFKREWGKFTNNDRQRFEGELDRFLGQVQQRYGYTSERAWNELDRYWRGYGKAGQAAVNATLKGFQGQKSSERRIPWFALAGGALVLWTIISQLRQPAAPSPGHSTSEQKRQESLRQERERDLVDEQSWESFPASDPPASW